MPRPAAHSLLALALLGLAAAPAAAAPWAIQHFPTGTSFNHTVAVGDLDADGRPDVAIPNSQAGAVTVLLGNGDGTLAPFTAWATFSEPQDVAIADLTGDGIPDLATADYTSGGVTLLRGLGDGTFATRVLVPAGAGLIALAPVDLDGDGRLDLALSKEPGNKLVVLPALPTGGFGAAVETGTGAVPHQIAAAQLNAGAQPDLVLASNGAAAVSVHLGNGTFAPGAATPFAAGGAPVGLTVADLNGDGDADLLVSNVNAATLSVLMGNGDGTFAAPVPYATDPRPRGMDAGDLDGDGIPEVAIATGYPDGDSLLTLYRGRGDGTLEILAHVRLPYRAADCVIADMNADGWRDIVVTGPQAGVVSVLVNPGGNVGVETPVQVRGLELAVTPNPMRGMARFAARVPAGMKARVEILDLAGRRIAELGTLADRETATWRGETLRGGRAAPGIYLARITAGGAAVTLRVVLLGR